MSEFNPMFAKRMYDEFELLDSLGIGYITFTLHNDELYYGTGITPALVELINGADEEDYLDRVIFDGLVPVKLKEIKDITLHKMTEMSGEQVNQIRGDIYDLLEMVEPLSYKNLSAMIEDVLS